MELLLGKLDWNYETIGLTLTIDGEDAPTLKKYAYLNSYNPNRGDRVLIADVGDSYVVLGAITNYYSEASNAKAIVSNRWASDIIKFEYESSYLYYIINNGSRRRLANG